MRTLLVSSVCFIADVTPRALTKGGPKGTEYKRWFGEALHGDRHTSVVGHFQTLAANNFSQYTYACNAHFCVNRPGLFGYVYPNK